jgi:dihydroorotase
MTALETTLALVITHLILPGHLDWRSALAKLTINPARILGVPLGTLAAGAPADVTIIDPAGRWTVVPERLRSKSTNTPLAGQELVGRVLYTIVDGEIRYRADDAVR